MSLGPSHGVLGKIAVSESTAAELLEIGESTFRRLKAKGILPQPRRIGGSARYLVSELVAAVEAMPVSDLPGPPTRRPAD